MADPQLKCDAELWFGADPEIFLSQNGIIVGSERAIPEEGLSAGTAGSYYSIGEEVTLVRDGVQVELNLPPTKCREWLAMEIQLALRALHRKLQKDQKFEISFLPLVEVSAEEIASLTPLSRRLGCAPSFNYYHPNISVGVNPDTYLKRSAAGHLHFGLPPHLIAERERLPPLCDIIIGNTLVLLDRDPAQIERRKVYGRAGEFRSPRHGLEYRTPSNFWLRSKELVGFVTGLMRLTTFVLDTAVAEKGGWPADQALLDLVDLSQIEKAINLNDVDLAKANFEGLKTFLQRHLKVSSAKKYGEVSLDGAKLHQFDKFIKGIDESGIEKWFPEDPITHWQHCDWLQGWELFLNDI